MAKQSNTAGAGIMLLWLGEYLTQYYSFFNENKEMNERKLMNPYLVIDSISSYSILFIL